MTNGFLDLNTLLHRLSGGSQTWPSVRKVEEMCDNERVRGPRTNSGYHHWDILAALNFVSASCEEDLLSSIDHIEEVQLGRLYYPGY